MLDGTQPVLPRRRAGIELAAEDADLSLFICNSNSRAEREEVHLDRLHAAAGPGHPDHAGRPGRARRWTRSPARDPGGDRGPRPRAAAGSARSRSTTCSVAGIAVEHLLDQGTRRVAFIGGPESIGQVRERLQGAREAGPSGAAGRRPGVPADRRADRQLRAASAGERLAGLPARRRPTAAFCANDLLALGLLQQGDRLRPAGAGRSGHRRASTTSSSRRPPRCR